MRSLAHATCTGRELLTSGLQAVTVTRRAHLMRLRVRYASSHTPGGLGTIAFCGRGKAYLHTRGIIQFAMRRTYTSRYMRPLANARDYYVALRRIAVRRLMENALLPLGAVLRLPTIRSHLSTCGTARVEDLTRAFSRAHEDPNDSSGRASSRFVISYYTIRSICRTFTFNSTHRISIIPRLYLLSNAMLKHSDLICQKSHAHR